MKRFAVHRIAAGEEGAALPSVLIVITIISLMAGVVMSGVIIQSRFIQRDIDALRARYTAEAGIFKYLATDSTLITGRTTVGLPDSSSTIIQSERFGGYLRVTSTAIAGNTKKTVQVLVGRSPDRYFEQAVVLGDARSRLHLAGLANITGGILTGPMGVKKNAFKGKLYEGTLNGRIQKLQESPFPRYDASFFREQLEKYMEWVDNPPGRMRRIKPGRYAVSTFRRLEGSRVIFTDGDLELYSTKNAKLPDSLTVIAAGDLVLDGALRYRPYTRFVAGRKLRVSGSVNGKHGLFVARQIFIEDQVSCSGQYLALNELKLSNSAYLRFPSVLYLEGLIEGSRRKGRIELSQRAVLDGVALMPLPVKTLADDGARIVVGNRAVVRGGIYNSAQTELHGRVLGSAVTFQFYFYFSPTAYINWLKDSTIDLSKRPRQFAMPFGFSENERFEILDWKEI